MSDEVDGEQEVRNWLNSIKLGKYADAFVEAGFDDLEVLAHLTDADLGELATPMPAGHRKKLLLKARDLGSATLRGYYANGEYVPPAKSLITSKQLAELKVAERMAKAKAAASGAALSPAAATEMKLLLKTEVLRDLQNEGFDVGASLADAEAQLEAAKAAESDADDDDDDDDDDGDVRSESVKSPGKKRPHSGKKKKKRATTLKASKSAPAFDAKKGLDGKKAKRKKAIEKKKARHHAAKLAGKTLDDSAAPSGSAAAAKKGKRSSTIGADGTAMSIAAKLAAESGKPVPIKVHLAQRPDDPLIFSIFYHNTAQEVVQLAARTLGVPASDFVLRQVGPGKRAERLEPSTQPLVLVAQLGGDAHLYHFELAPRSKTFVRFYDAHDSSKFYTLEVDGDTEAGDVVEQIAQKLGTADDSIVLISSIGDRKRELEEYEFVRDIMDKAAKRGSEVTFSVADRNSLADVMGGAGAGGDDDLLDDVDAGGALQKEGSLTNLGVVSGSGELPRGPFWNAMAGGAGAAAPAAESVARRGLSTGALDTGAGVQAITVQYDDLTDRWAISLRKSLREQLGSLAAKFNIADVHNYDFYFVDAGDVPAKGSVPREALNASQKLNINVPVSDASVNDRLVLVPKSRSAHIGATPQSGLQKFAAAASGAAAPARTASMPATNGSGTTFKRAVPTAQRMQQEAAARRPNQPAPAPQRRSTGRETDSSTEDNGDAPMSNIAQKRRSILKAFSGGADSDVTSDDSRSDRKVSFGARQQS